MFVLDTVLVISVGAVLFLARWGGSEKRRGGSVYFTTRCMWVR